MSRDASYRWPVCFIVGRAIGVNGFPFADLRGVLAEIGRYLREVLEEGIRDSQGAVPSERVRLVLPTRSITRRKTTVSGASLDRGECQVSDTSIYRQDRTGAFAGCEAREVACGDDQAGTTTTAGCPTHQVKNHPPHDRSFVDTRYVYVPTTSLKAQGTRTKLHPQPEPTSTMPYHFPYNA